MTGAERFRRWWLKHRKEKPPNEKPVTRSTSDKDIERLKARVRDLEAESVAKDHAIARWKAELERARKGSAERPEPPQGRPTTPAPILKGARPSHRDERKTDGRRGNRHYCGPRGMRGGRHDACPRGTSWPLPP